MTSNDMVNCPRCLRQFRAVPVNVQTRIVALEAERDALREALRRIVEWADAYPRDIFPEPDWRKARNALEGFGLTLGAISAANMRHVIKGVGQIARAALKASD